MGKYEPLSEFLRKHTSKEIRMTFQEIERIIGDKLPPSAHEYRAWWSNNPNNSVMTKAWIEAGFRSEQVDMEGGSLVFRRVGGPEWSGENSSPISAQPSPAADHPIIGCLKGTARIAPGVDLTEPADPGWGERAWVDQK